MNEIRRNADVNWDTFNPGTYGQKYFFSALGPEDLWVATETIDFMADQGFTEGYFENGADIGTGPSLVLPLAGISYVQKMDLIEPGAQNAEYLRRVLQNPDLMQQDWSDIERRFSEEPKALPVQEHAARLLMERAVVCQTDIAGADPDSYDLLTSCFCAESATGDIDECEDMVQSILRLVKKGGAYSVAYIEHSEGYPDYAPDDNGTIDPRKFPAADIDKEWLERQLKGTNITVRRCPYGQEMRKGYGGVLLAIGTK